LIPHWNGQPITIALWVPSENFNSFDKYLLSIYIETIYQF
jgi:hypothetical protein